MKTIRRALIVTLLLATCLAVLSGCQSYSEEDGYSILRGALANSLTGINHDVNFVELTEVFFDENGTKHTDIINVNVLADEKNYDIIVNDGNYVNLHAYAKESSAIGNTDTKVFKEVYYGYANGEKYLVGFEGGAKTYLEKVSDDELYTDAYFKKYTLDAFLDEVNYLQLEDMDFSIGKGGVERQGYVTALTFKPTDEYLAKYATEKGKASSLNADYVVIEIAYDRVQSVIAYKREPGFESFPDAIAIDYETYKLEISYRGPKFSSDISGYVNK